jgi:branched-chain amino acid transport system permease protein
LSQLAYFVLVGLGVGAVYALVAAGISIIFSSSQILNFAQGGFVMIGGLTAAILSQKTDSFLLGAIGAAIVGTLVAAAAGYLITAPLRKGESDRDLLVVGTIGIAIVLENCVAELWGRNPILVKALLQPWTGLRVADAIVPWHYFLMVGVTVVLFGGVALVYGRTDLGIRLRAIAEDIEAATAAGIDVFRTLIGAFALAGLLGGLAGALVGVVVPISYSVGLPLALSGFVAAVLGGLFRPIGALLGGLIYGVSETVAAGFLPGEVRFILGPMLIATVMAIRPEGLLGKRRLRRV